MRGRWLIWAVVIGGFGAGVASGMVGLPSILKPGGAVSPWVTIGTLVIAPPFAFLVHEGGHLVAGVLAGMSPVLMNVGPVGLRWNRDGVWPRVRTGAFVPGGFTLFSPGSADNVRIRMIVMVAGGPAASLFLAVIVGAIFLVTDGNVRQAAGFTGMISVCIFLMTAFGRAATGIVSDGVKIRMLLRNDAQSRSFAACLGLMAAARSGLRPANWAADLVESALQAEKGSPFHISALHFAFWVALDAGEMDRADALLSTLLEDTAAAPESIAAPVVYEAAAFRLFVQKDPKAVRALIDGRRLPAFEDRYLEPLVRAGLALAEGHMGQAARFAQEAHTALPRALLPSVAALHARWLEHVEAEISHAAGSSVCGPTA